jgi:hypothetical protein
MQNGIFDFPIKDQQVNKSFTFWTPSNATFVKTFKAPEVSFYAFIQGQLFDGSTHWDKMDDNWFVVIVSAGHPPKLKVDVNSQISYDNRLYEISGFRHTRWYNNLSDLFRVYNNLRQIVRDEFFYSRYVDLIFRSHFLTEYKPWSGISSMVAWLENGVTFWDAGQVYEFRDYLEAYKTYGGQIGNAARLSEIQAENKINDFKRQLNENLNQEKNRLDALALQIRNATENDARSAMRDLQNLQLNAQNLFLNLQRSLQ